MRRTALTHTFNDQQLRHVMIDGEPWFVAVDACRCLDLNVEKGTTHHLRKLDGDEKRIARRQDYPVLDTG
ncbi:hypothetical protein, partial [Erythrobacter sp.]|uniref:hypothetical protein n=1 Tax=Erythrobacter sp. TaxID=1042 RepID=UPI0035302809